MEKTKSFEISKQVVWKAYQRVKANKRAAGIDKESIMDFEQKLKDNLYKLWNRMSSGSYFPPPVKAVEIPKKNGGLRVLGIPTVADRIAQNVASKAGVIGLTRSIAAEVGEFGVTANTIGPGKTMTEVPRETVNKESMAKVMARRMIKRTETPEDLVGITLFMASEEANFMTGQTVIVDGGMVFLP